MSRTDVVHIDIVSERASSRQPSTRQSSTRKPTRDRPPARIEDIDDLPPLPSPDFASRHAQACRGSGLVMSVTGVLVGLPHVVRSRAPPDAVGPPLAAQLCLYAVALAGLGCLCRLLCADPGSLKRSREVCFPLPAAVQKRLSARKSLDGLQNVRASTGRVYCIRCCIWRPASREELIHHCSICQVSRDRRDWPPRLSAALHCLGAAGRVVCRRDCTHPPPRVSLLVRCDACAALRALA